MSVVPPTCLRRPAPHLITVVIAAAACSSIAAKRGFGAQVAYCASKGALLPLSKSLATAWGKDNVQVGAGRWGRRAAEVRRAAA